MCFMDGMGEPLVTLVHLHCTLCHELEQLYYHAVASNLLVPNFRSKQGEHESYCCALHHQLSLCCW